jgi:flagellar motor switch protein FliN/FliY
MTAENNNAAIDEWDEVLSDKGKDENSDTSGQYVLEGETRQNGETRPLDFILDIPLEISVELGRTNMLINELLQLGPGSVIELDKLAGEPMEILVNEKLVARGEVVVIKDKFAIRLTDIVSPIERIKSLK